MRKVTIQTFYCKYRNRYDVIEFDENLNLEELTKYLRVLSTVDQLTKDKIINIIEDF